MIKLSLTQREKPSHALKQLSTLITIPQENQTSLSLDPAHSPSDHPTLSHHRRISQTLPIDIEKLAVTMLPNDITMERIIVSNQSTSHSLISPFTNHCQDLLEESDHQNRLRFKVYASNLMIKSIEKLEVLLNKEDIPTAENGEYVTAHAQNSRSEHILDNISTQDLTQRTGLPANYRKTISAFKAIVDPLTAEKDEKLAAHHNTRISQCKSILDTVSAQEFTQQTGLPPQYLKTLAAYEDIIQERNKACHNTECEFARILLSRQFRDPVMAQKWKCERWSTLLLWVTGYDTLEEMKKVSDDVGLSTVL